MTEEEKTIDWLINKPFNYDKLEKAAKLNQGTVNRILRGLSKKHIPTITKYFKNLTWL